VTTSTVLIFNAILITILIVHNLWLRYRLQPDRYRVVAAALRDRVALLIGGLFAMASASGAVASRDYLPGIVGSILAGYTVTLLVHTIRERRKRIHE